MALVLAFLSAENENRQLEDLPRADFSRVPEILLLSVRTKSMNENFLVFNTTSHSFAALAHELSTIYAPMYYSLFKTTLWKVYGNESMNQLSTRQCTILYLKLLFGKFMVMNQFELYLDIENTFKNPARYLLHNLSTHQPRTDHKQNMSPACDSMTLIIVICFEGSLRCLSNHLHEKP